jgi:hypothetical protein
LCNEIVLHVKCLHIAERSEKFTPLDSVDFIVPFYFRGLNVRHVTMVLSVTSSTTESTGATVSGSYTTNATCRSTLGWSRHLHSIRKRDGNLNFTLRGSARRST